MGLLAGELSESERAEILGHAKQCDHCANQIRELEALQKLLRGPLRDALQDLHPSPEALMEYATRQVPSFESRVTSHESRLSASEAERISRHIENCPRCSEETRLVQDATTLSHLPLPLPNRERERLGSHGGSIRRPRSEAEGAGVRVLRPAIRALVGRWLRPRLLIPLAAAAAVALIAYIQLRPGKTQLLALPIVITDQTFSALHGGTGADIDVLAAELEPAYRASLAQARGKTRFLNVDIPDTSLIRRGGTGERVGRPLPLGHKPEEGPSPGKRGLVLEIQMFVKDRNICSLRSVARRGDGSIVLSLDKPDFNCQEATAEVTRIASNLLRQLDSHETSQ